MQRDSVIARSEVERIQKMQDDVFNKGCIPWWVGVGGYVIFAILAIVVIPFLYTPVRWCAVHPSLWMTRSLVSTSSGNVYTICHYYLSHPCHGRSSAMVQTETCTNQGLHHAAVLNAEHIDSMLNMSMPIFNFWQCQRQVPMLCRYYVLVLAVIVPFFAVANAYGTGLTDFDMSSVYGTVSNLCPTHAIESQ